MRGALVLTFAVAALSSCGKPSCVYDARGKFKVTPCVVTDETLRQERDMFFRLQSPHTDLSKEMREFKWPDMDPKKKRKTTGEKK